MTNAPFQRDQILRKETQNNRSRLMNLGFMAFRLSIVI